MLAEPGLQRGGVDQRGHGEMQYQKAEPMGNPQARWELSVTLCEPLPQEVVD
jgi:hypothetical protein